MQSGSLVSFLFDLDVIKLKSGCYKAQTWMLQTSNMDVTKLKSGCNEAQIWMLQISYMGVTNLKSGCYKATTWMCLTSNRAQQVKPDLVHCIRQSPNSVSGKIRGSEDSDFQSVSLQMYCSKMYFSKVKFLHCIWSDSVSIQIYREDVKEERAEGGEEILSPLCSLSIFSSVLCVTFVQYVVCRFSPMCCVSLFSAV